MGYYCGYKFQSFSDCLFQTNGTQGHYGQALRSNFDYRGQYLDIFLLPPPPSLAPLTIPLAPLSLLEKDKTQFHFALLPFSEQLNSTQTTTGNNHLQKITGSNLWMRNLYHENFAYFRKRKSKLSTCDLITGQYRWGMVNLGLQNSFSQPCTSQFEKVRSMKFGQHNFCKICNVCASQVIISNPHLKLTVLFFFNQWLRKMASAGRKTDNANTDAVDMEEMNPVWLKDKGM